MPIMTPPRVTFGAKIQPARNVYAKKLAQVRKRYVAGANRRNNAAIRTGIKARTAMSPPGAAVAPSSAPPLTQSILHSFVALNEALLDLSNPSSDTAAKDPEYQKLLKRAFESESPEKKEKYHQRAATRATELGCVERAERHGRIANAQASLSAER